MIGYDYLGNIVILKFDKNAKAAAKKKFALALLKKQKHVTTVLEKTQKFSGRLRTLKTKWLAGEKTKEALYRENKCVFRFNVESCYFSPRLASERLEVARLVKNGESVLVLFGGVAPFAIVIAKFSKPARVVSVELGRECSKYALENVRRNKLQDRVEIVQGDVRKKLPKMKENAKKSPIFGASKTKRFEGFDRIVMARPNLSDSFLDVAFPRIKKNGIIHYYGFYKEADILQLRELIEKEARRAKKKVSILRIRKAGDIGPYKFRYRADLKILN